jgi:hypothetical protein
MPWFIGGTVAAVLSLGAFFVFVFTRDTSGESQQAVCGLVIDRTGSVSNETTLTQYRQMASRAVDGCRENRARLNVYYFDQSNQKLILAGPPHNLWLPEGDRREQQEEDLAVVTERAQAEVADVFERPPGEARSSDVLTALGEAADDVSSQARADGVDERYVVMVTDGLQNSSDVAVEDLTGEEVSTEPMVERARELGLIAPGLDGVQVDFVGVRSGQSIDGQQLPEWFEAKVEDFWRQVVEDGGGSVCRYGATATRLPDSC